MASSDKPSDDFDVSDDGVQTPKGPNKGQLHGGQQGGRSVDVQHNQATAVQPDRIPSSSPDMPQQCGRRIHLRLRAVVCLSAACLALGCNRAEDRPTNSGPAGDRPPVAGVPESPGGGQRAAAERLRTAGATVHWFNGREDSYVERVTFGEHPVSTDTLPPEHLRPLAELPDLREANFWLKEPPVAGTGLRHLVGLKKLETVVLLEQPVTDEDVQVVTRIPSIVTLDLSRTRVTDRIVPDLSQMPNLRNLYLPDTAVSDASVPVLSRMVGLKDLRIVGSGISIEGRLKLEQVFPQGVVN
jgi:hypothetical protein